MSIRQRLMAGEVPTATMLYRETRPEPRLYGQAMEPGCLAASVSPQSLQFNINERSSTGAEDETARSAHAIPDQPEFGACAQEDRGPRPPLQGTGARRSRRNKGKEISYKEPRTNVKMRQAD